MNKQFFPDLYGRIHYQHASLFKYFQPFDNEHFALSMFMLLIGLENGLEPSGLLQSHSQLFNYLKASQPFA